MIKKYSIFFLGATFLFAEQAASLSGNTGVLETPNARIMPDWSMRLFINEDKPYRYYGFAATPLPFLEANFHVTQVQGVAGFSDAASYGDYKDKSLNLKFQVKKESKYFPSIVFGADDVWGTALYTSKYIAMSKKISFFDFTLGYAKGRLGGEDLRKYTSNSSTNSGSLDNNAVNFLKNTNWGGGKPFGSIVFHASPKLDFLYEYSSIDYKKDKINPFLTGKNYELPKSKMNIGLRYKATKNSYLTLAYQRGNQFSFGYTYQFAFSKDGMFTHLPDKKWKADKKKLKEYENLDEKTLSDKLSNEVAAEKFSNVQTSVYKNKIWSEIDNPRYNLDLQAIGRAISTIDEVAPDKYDTIFMTLKKKNVPIKTFKVNRTEFDLHENEKVSDLYMKKALKISNNVEKEYDEFSENKKDIYKTNIYGTQKFKYKIAPKLRSYLNKKEKPLALKISARAAVSYEFTSGTILQTAIEYPLYNGTKDLPTEPLETGKLSLRSDLMDHLKYNKTQVPYFSLTHLERLKYQSFGKIEAGYLDYAFAGVDLEWYKPLFDERAGIGLQYQYVYKRDPLETFALKDDYKYDAKFLNLYYLLSPKYDLHLGLKIGEFLAGDKGLRFEIQRNYKQFSLGAFATITNSKEVFSNEKNRGYIDKGIFLKVPLDVFTYKNVKGRANYGLSPWTRDVGQFAGTTHSLYPMNNSENNTQIMKKNINYLQK